ANRGSDNVSVLLGHGDSSGTFAHAVNYPTGDRPSSVAVGYFNDDDYADLAVANAGSDTVSVLPGNGDGTFAAAVSFAAGDGPNSVAVADFNGDVFDSDLAVANAGSGTVSVLLADTPPTITRDLATVTVNEGTQATNTGTFDD